MTSNAAAIEPGTAHGEVYGDGAPSSRTLALPSGGRHVRSIGA